MGGCSFLFSGPEPENGTDLTEADMMIEDFAYTNQDNETVTNEDLEGSYWVTNMIFTSCPTVCNLMTPNMLSLQGQLEEADAGVPLVSFTVDPSNDDPETLKAYGEEYGADFSSWHFLTGYSDEEMKALAGDSFLSTVEKDEENDDIIHPTSFYLVNPDGQIIRSYDGLDNDTDLIAEDVKALVNE
ncbi:protein SCO1/2 [Sinobaca qinghaiensis]|uniref:Protein SCO1/2 n=1 Tax=Sinobaca qinghaiensis TaxID=342944 RepID=A0A419V6L8_9BACL|nr:SCO family protein [Sinobaca qinghaiensis]RKD75609.1 protein SCO1/2 [Sinobaca qinghaiensis]